MSIFPLPQFEADMERADHEAYERLKPPSSIVVRYGRMRMVGEFPYGGDAKPGCGSKLVVRTPRGVEIGEMLTSTCPNAGCSKSVTRKQMLEYIENSGGLDYPFTTEGRVLRVATVEDLNEQSRLDATIPATVRVARDECAAIGLDMRFVDAEPILGGERLTFYFTSEQRVDFRELVRRLAQIYNTRIELRQVGARDEARITADYERCGQHCCCKQFLKVLKPISMRSAKVQKATLDPLKISGRCGRLMCCLRYEDETYETLRKRLPRRGLRVGTPEGAGVVVDTQILTQLVLVSLESDQRRVAIPVEELTDPDAAPPETPRTSDPLRGASTRDVRERAAEPTPDERRESRRRGKRGSRAERQDQYRERAQREPREPRDPREPREPREPPARPDAPPDNAASEQPPADPNAPKRKRRRRRKKRRGGDGPSGPRGAPGGGSPDPS